ncbi:MAG TPA: hypothetical protein VFC25_10110 [Verrucomicrobiae bacterium]|nr:hypothetical protein [Verrucomicrobiae bacterium]
MDRLIRILGANGSRVMLTPEDKPRTLAIVNGQNIFFSLWESSKRYEHIPSKREAEESKERRYRTYEMWDHKPTGLMTLEMERWRYWGIRTKWCDRKEERVEEQIESFVEGLKQAAVKAREVEEERERERRAREAEQERLLAEQRRREEERRRVEELKRQAITRRESRLILDLVDDVRARGKESGLLDADDAQLSRWLAWAIQCAENLDPVVGILDRHRPALSQMVECVDLAQPAISPATGISSGSTVAQPAPASQNITYDRKTLYGQVWARPVQVVAKDYAISGRGLAKVCSRLRVPVPPRGYWARVRNGHHEKRPMLPRQNG